MNFTPRSEVRMNFTPRAEVRNGVKMTSASARQGKEAGNNRSWRVGGFASVVMAFYGERVWGG